MVEALRTAWEMFRTQRIRFALTISGVVVGVASLVVLASVLDVGQDLLSAASTEATGDDVVTVSNDWETRDRWPEERRLDARDYQALDESSLLDGMTLTANYGMEDRPVTRGADTDTPFTIGVTDRTFPVYQLALESGRRFTASESTGTERVAIAGASVLEEFHGVKVGEVLRVDGKPFLIVGVLEKKHAMGPGEFYGWNRRLLIPARVYNLEFNPSRRPSNIVGKVAPPVGYAGTVKDYVFGVQKLMRLVLMADREHQSFRFEGVSEDSQNEEIIVFVIKALILLTTVFSMVVGGINIMNIMLVTVTERTKEIGLRRALGATRRDILRQFLAETLAITLVGASLGVATALALLGAAAAYPSETVDWPFHVATWSLGLAVVFTSLIGLVFGLLPAVQASRLEPVEALRHD